VRVPNGHTEATVLAAIEKAVGILAHEFRFGPHTVEDIAQQGRLLALELLERDVYDPRVDRDGKPTRSLGAFVYSHVHNRLCNFKRDNWQRNDPPCRACDDGYPCSRDREGTPTHCKRYAGWLANNKAKSAVRRPLDIGNVADEKEARMREEDSAFADLEMAELLAAIDAAMPPRLRSAYLRMREGEPVGEEARREVEDVVRSAYAGS